MSRAEAEMAKLAQDFNFDVTTDFGQIEQVIQDKIGLNRAKARVAADLSGEGVGAGQAEQADGEGAGANRPCSEFEVQMGLRTPETPKVAPRRPRSSGPAKETVKQN